MPEIDLGPIIGPQGPQGATGPAGAVGPRVPAGGTAGQIVTKKSSTGFDTEWRSPVNDANQTEAGYVLDARMGKTLGDAINTLNSNFVYDWSPFTKYVSPDETEANGVIARLGKIRSISYRGVSRVHTEDDVIATLPEGDRPSHRIYVTGNIGGTCVVVSINNNGQITIYTLNGATTSARLFFGITYIIQ